MLRKRLRETSSPHIHHLRTSQPPGYCRVEILSKEKEGCIEGPRPPSSRPHANRVHIHQLKDISTLPRPGPLKRRRQPFTPPPDMSPDRSGRRTRRRILQRLRDAFTAGADPASNCHAMHQRDERQREIIGLEGQTDSAVTGLQVHRYLSLALPMNLVEPG